jgi:diadenosine tetraphosphate (Ap4A) HIT family hydrolase
MYYYSPFRSSYKGTKDRDPSICVFCDEAHMHEQTVCTAEGTLIENAHYRWVVNIFPKFEGHTLVVPKRHVLHLGEESSEEVAAREDLIVRASRALCALYPGAGIEVFIQTGEGSESSIPHLHWHVVPSLPGDTLRGFDKLGHFFTIEDGKEKVVLFPVPIRLAQNDLLNALKAVL